MIKKCFSKTLLLFKKERFTKLQNTKVLILGVGGINNFTLNCLYHMQKLNIFSVLGLTLTDEFILTNLKSKKQ